MLILANKELDRYLLEINDDNVISHKENRD